MFYYLMGKMLSNRQLQTWELYATPDALFKGVSLNIRTQSFCYIAEMMLLPQLIGKIKGNEHCFGQNGFY